MARAMLIIDRRFTPLSIPATTEKIARPVMAAIAIFEGHHNRRKQIVHLGVDLRYRQAKSRGDTEQGAEDGKGIDGVFHPAVDTITNQWIEGSRAHRQRQAMTEGKIRQ